MRRPLGKNFFRIPDVIFQFNMRDNFVHKNLWTGILPRNNVPCDALFYVKYEAY
jgi:hypothetical protein